MCVYVINEFVNNLKVNKMKNISKALALTTLTVAMSGSVQAFPLFQVQEGAIPNSGSNLITADKINGEYVETVTITSSSTFSTSLRLQLQGFSDTTTSSTPVSQLNAFNGYNMYLLYKSIGTFNPNGVGFDYFTTDATFELWVDDTQDTSFSDPATPLGSTLAAVDFYTVNDTSSDDALMASGIFLSGSATQTCSGAAANNNCGSFGQTTTFNLENPLGVSYFVDPDPFYTLSIQSGNFNGFVPTPGTSQTISGVANIIFNVPEPTTVALLGMGLLGFGLTKRNKKA